MVTVIIDDDKQAALDLANHLEKYESIEVVGMAHNGFDGLTLVSESQPDLLFLDVELPDISGLDFLDRVRVFTHGGCRVVMYTAYDRFVLPSFRKKAFDVLLKPIDEQDLTGVIDRLMQESSHLVAKKKEVNLENKKNGKLLLYTNTLDFRLIDKRDIGLFQYSHETRCWEALVAGNKSPVKLKRSVKSDMLVALDEQFMQVNQKFIVNMNYLIEVVDNVCHFYPPFDMIEYVKVGRLFRRKFVERFSSL